MNHVSAQLLIIYSFLVLVLKVHTSVPFRVKMLNFIGTVVKFLIFNVMTQTCENHPFNKTASEEVDVYPSPLIIIIACVA